MDIHIIQLNELDQINEALDEITDLANRLITKKDAAPDIAIRAEVDIIRKIFAPLYYIFRCIKCDQLYATTESDLRMMLKPCRRCKEEHMLVFVDKTTVKPDGCVTRGTF